MSRSSINLLNPTEQDRVRMDLWERTRKDPTKKITAFTHLYDPNYTVRYPLGNSHTKSGLDTEKEKNEFYSRSLDVKSLNIKQPLIDILNLPQSERPSTLEECLRFFYPLSGEKFIGTDVGAYHTEYIMDPRNIDRVCLANQPSNCWNEFIGPADISTTTMPAELGDLSMFYGWFLIYRMLLCPRTFIKLRSDLNIEKFFLESEDLNKRIILPQDIMKIKQNQAQIQQGYLSNLRDTTQVAQQITSAVLQNPEILDLAASGNLQMQDVLANVQNSEAFKDLMTRGLSYVSRKLQDQFGIPQAATNAISTYMLQGKVPEITVNSIMERAKDIQDDISTSAKSKLKDFVIMNVSKASREQLGFEVDFSAFRGLEDELLNFELNPTQDKLNKLLQKTRDQNLKVYLTNRLNNLKPLSNTNEKQLMQKAANGIIQQTQNTALKLNGLPLLLVGVGTSMAFNAIKGYLDAKIAEIVQFQKDLEAYYSASQITINPLLMEEGYTFGFETFAHLGLKSLPFGLTSSEQDWEGKPFCSPVQGLQVAQYWDCIFTIYNSIFNKFNSQNHTNLKSLLNTNSIKESEAKTLTFTDIYNQKGAGRYGCVTFKIFVENALRSTRTILDNLPKFTSFTKAFGFCPTFLIKGTYSDAELRNIWSASPSATLPDILVSGSPENGGWVYTSSRKNGWFVPEMTTTYSHPTSKDDTPVSASPWGKWKTNDIQNIKRPDLDSGSNSNGSFRRTINSQRRFEADENDYGFYGNRTSISFDVTNDVPIFNAQWNAMLAVLFCYPEALDTLANNGYTWAVELKKTASKPLPSILPNLPSIFKNLSFAEGTSKSEIDDEELVSKPSNSVANVALASTVTLSALGLATFVYHKKNPKALKSLNKNQKIGVGVIASTLVVGSGAITYLLSKK